MDKDENNKDDMLGECQVLLGKIWGSKGNIIELPLQISGKNAGKSAVIVRVETVKESAFVYNLEMEWLSCPNVKKGCCGSAVRPVNFDILRQVGQ